MAVRTGAGGNGRRARDMRTWGAAGDGACAGAGPVSGLAAGDSGGHGRRGEGIESPTASRTGDGDGGGEQTQERQSGGQVLVLVI